MKSNHAEEQREKTMFKNEKTMFKNEKMLRELCDNATGNKICFMGSQKEKREKGLESVFKEIIAENSNLEKKTGIQILEAQRNTNMMNPRSPYQDS